MSEIETRLGKVLRKAEFDPKLKVYWILSGLLILTVTMIGIPLIPFWLILGPYYCGKKLRSLESVLTEKALIVRGGVMIRVEQTIPLDRIQDLTLTEGPLLKMCGLCSIHVETAGAATTAGRGGGAGLSGVIDAREFRNAVLDQREIVAAGGGGAESSAPASLGGGGASDGSAVAVLGEIRDSLLRIEEHLKAK